MQTSKRINELMESPIRKLVPYAMECEAKGIDVIKMNIGQPDIHTPHEYFQAIKEYNIDVLSYAHSQGLPELIQSFVRYYERFNLFYQPEDIIITQGASEGITFSLSTICDPDDEVLVPEPFYANYKSFSDIVSVRLKPIRTFAENGFCLPDYDQITKLITHKTKGILLSNPGNPTGRVYNRDELQTIVRLALDKNLFILSDEVYKEFIYTNDEFVSLGHYSEIQDRLILLDSISKRFSCCGARIGTVATKNRNVIDNMMKLAQARLSVATLEQVGAAALIHVGDSYMQETKEAYRKRKDIIYRELSNMEGVICYEPSGAFYNIVKLPIDDTETFVIWMLKNIHIDQETLLITPAEDFYLTKGLGKNEARISYCIHESKIQNGMRILKKALALYPGRI